jgi:hypothetical protein
MRFHSQIHNAFLFAGIAGTLLSAGLSLQFWLLELDAMITSSRLVCEQPLNNRCTTRFEGKSLNEDNVDLTSKLTEFPLSELVVGNSIRKEKYAIQYFVNGKRENWKFLWYHLIVLIPSVMSVLFWYSLNDRFTKLMGPN